MDLGPIQIYKDALNETVEIMSRKPTDHSTNFLELLGVMMMDRGLAARDRILFPERNELGVASIQALSKMIDESLVARPSNTTE